MNIYNENNQNVSNEPFVQNSNSTGFENSTQYPTFNEVGINNFEFFNYLAELEADIKQLIKRQNILFIIFVITAVIMFVLAIFEPGIVVICIGLFMASLACTLKISADKLGAYLKDKNGKDFNDFINITSYFYLQFLISKIISICLVSFAAVVLVFMLLMLIII